MENDKLREAAEQALGSLKALGAEYGYAATLLADALNDTAHNPSPGYHSGGIEFVADCLRKYAHILRSGQIDSAGHYYPDGIDAAAGWLTKRYALSLAPQNGSGGPPEPLFYASEEQIASVKDVDAEGGTYLPVRKTPAGKFLFPLYAKEASQ